MEESFSCSDCAAFEFQPENIAPVHNNRNHFLRSQWNLPWAVYVVYRVGVALLFTAWIIGDFFDEAGTFYKDDYAIWLVFATNWSFLLLGVCAVFHAGIVLNAYVSWRRSAGSTSTDTDQGSAENQRGLDITTMVFWILYNCAANGALVVTTSYWTFLVSFSKAGFLITTMSRLKHTLNTVYVIFDLMFGAMPIRIFHVIYPLFWGAIYTVFNVLYFTNNGIGPNGKPYAYYVMDWRNPLESALTCSLGFILSTIMQCVLYGFYRLRLYAYGRLTGARYDIMTLPGVVGCSFSDSETDNILTEARDRTASYSSTETIERDTGHEEVKKEADVVRERPSDDHAALP